MATLGQSPEKGGMGPCGDLREGHSGRNSMCKGPEATADLCPSASSGQCGQSKVRGRKNSKKQYQREAMSLVFV